MKIELTDSRRTLELEGRLKMVESDISMLKAQFARTLRDITVDFVEHMRRMKESYERRPLP